MIMPWQSEDPTRACWQQNAREADTVGASQIPELVVWHVATCVYNALLRF